MTIIDTKSTIELSRGCRCCQAGTWLCLFLGMRCNCNCWFCSRPLRNEVEDEPDDTYLGMGFGELARKAVEQGVEGVGYSGGEPLLYLEKVLRMAERMREARPTMYQWLYTNGILLNETVVVKLRNAGISEIRMNLAAGGFDESTIDKLGVIRDALVKATVEMPAIPEVRDWLVKDGGIHRLARQGVEQLNLAELYVRRPEAFARLRNEKMYRSPFGPVPVWSRSLTREVVRFVQEKQTPILVHDCSILVKMTQVRKRKHSADLFALDRLSTEGTA